MHGQGCKNTVKLRKIKNLFTRGNFDLLLVQETRTDGTEKEIKRWSKIFNSKQIFLTNFGTNSVGAGIIVKNEEVFKVQHYFIDPGGRFVGIVGDHEEGKFLVLSFYSPSVENEIKKFVVNKLCKQLSEMGEDMPQFLILGGDTNTVFSRLDKIGGSQNLKCNAINAFEDLKSQYNLFDTFRLKNPFKREYSWETLNPQVIRERIDVIFISNALQDYITETGIIPPHKTCSDHGIPYVVIKGYGVPTKGPGLWKFNNSLLNEPCFVSEMNENLPKWINEAENDLPDNKGSQWGYIKHKIGEFSRNFGTNLKKAKILLKSNLEAELAQISQTLDDSNKIKYKNLKAQLDEIIEHEIKGSILRSLCRDYEQGEKCTKYFFSLEKSKCKQKTITRLKSAEGSLISEPKKVLEECRLFYKKLYSKNSDVNPDNFPFFSANDHIPKLDEEQKQSCENELTEAELHETLKSFAKNKSPGLDGITSEFYLEFWQRLKLKILGVYKESFLDGILPESLRTGVIVLLEKKGKDRMDIANWRPITLLGVDYKLLTKTLGQRLKKVLPNLIHKDQNGFVPGGNIFFSTHTIRDILFYCSKEKVDLIMLALDYAKAFDSVDFNFIHKTFDIFNFGDNFKTWIKLIYNGGKSCISNNGFISETFEIDRSTRQGDPISPLVFILVLEILFIHLRNDPNIRGIKIVKNEVKLTSYADDATYFLRDKNSAETLLFKIEKFSKVSGLEVNRTKSECMLLDFEMDLSRHDDKFCGIPVVDNVKVLGHYFGKDKGICDFQNFYSKITKFEKIENIWKQRPLTLLGKNLLINSLLNSLFIFNAQIEIPPTEFIKIIDAKNKNFLWRGTAKIAHHSLIGDYYEGGIKYKDLQTFVMALNYKFIYRLNNTCNLNSTCLPRSWLLQLFKIPAGNNEDDQNYFHDFFSNSLSILDCKFKVPRKASWKGHPYYYEILKSYESCTQQLPKSPENILSIPIWFNRYLSTKFNQQVSIAGFNYLRDLFMDGQPLTFNHVNSLNLTPALRRSLVNIVQKIPNYIQNLIGRATQKQMAIFPFQTINHNGTDYTLTKMDSKAIYSVLIYPKVKMPKGLLNWCADLELSDEQIKTSLTFAHKCCTNIFDRVFQFKIVTQILPTNEYLFRYRVKDANTCENCNLECDTIEHRLYNCEKIVPIVTGIFSFLENECNHSSSINMVEYLFGKMGEKYLALNQILLELKKDIFYNANEFDSSEAFCEHFICNLRSLMTKEKQLAMKNNKFVNFSIKWEHFTAIYDFRGPDMHPNIVD